MNERARNIWEQHKKELGKKYEFHFAYTTDLSLLNTKYIIRIISSISKIAYFLDKGPL
jgi:hypothetical protein